MLTIKRGRFGAVSVGTLNGSVSIIFSMGYFLSETVISKQLWRWCNF